MKEYIKLIKNVYYHGISHSDRTGTGRKTLFGPQIEFDLREGFPVPTTRKCNLNNIIKETIWFINGHSDVSILNKEKVNIWNNWAVKEEDIDKFINKYNNVYGEQFLSVKRDKLIDTYLNSIGPIYGVPWRNSPCSVSNVSELNPLNLTIDNLASDKKQFINTIIKDLDQTDTENM